MPYIKVIEQSEANEELRKIYSKVVGERGKLSNILKIQSLLPGTMLTHLELYKSIMFDKSDIKREDRELIAIVVSSANKCDYCVNHHAEALKHYWKDDKKVQQTVIDFRELNLSDKTNAMLEFAEKLTLTPDKMKADDIEILKHSGCEDAEILSLTLITNYFNFVNRNALALGVEFSEEEVKGYKY